MCSGKTYLVVDQFGVVKPGNGITRGCVKGPRIKGKEWSVPCSHTTTNAFKHLHIKSESISLFTLQPLGLLLLLSCFLENRDEHELREKHQFVWIIDLGKC